MDLAIVIPVFNEEITIKSLIEDLYNLFTSENISFQFIIINDGSTDNSLNILEALSQVIPNIKILSEKNCGHGPSLVKGYHLSLSHDWVFQIDSDYQYALSTFTTLWKNKDKYDMLIAERKQRNASLFRNFATAISQYLVLCLYGKGLRDVNSPYRLMRKNKLALALQSIHKNSFAPNILIAGYFLKNKFPIYSTCSELRININNRKSKMSFYIFKGCIKSITDILFFRFKI